MGAPVAKDEERAFSSAAASLHAKSFLVDRRQVFIGSLNLDPRSIVIDTEVGVLIDSTSLAEQWVQMFDVVTNPALAYEVTLQGEGRSAYAAWKTTAADGALVTIYKESDTTWWQRFKVGFLKMVPFVDSQL